MLQKKRTAQAVAFFFLSSPSPHFRPGSWFFRREIAFHCRGQAVGGDARSCLVSSKEVNFLRTQKSARDKIQASGAASTLSILCGAHTQFPEEEGEGIRFFPSSPRSDIIRKENMSEGRGSGCDVCPSLPRIPISPSAAAADRQTDKPRIERARHRLFTPFPSSAFFLFLLSFFSSSLHSNPAGRLRGKGPLCFVRDILQIQRCRGGSRSFKRMSY